jgi:hypothetical protein
VTRKAVDRAVDLLIIGVAVFILVLMGSFVLGRVIDRLGIDPSELLDFLEAILVAGFAAFVGYKRGQKSGPSPE